MAGENEITITGNLAADPELRFIQNGTPVANFRVISSSRQFDRATNEWKDGASISIRVEAWNELAENVAETLTKGTRVIVRGRLSQNIYEGRDGVERTSVELRAEDVAVSLRWATGQITRKRREGGQGGGGYGAPQGGGGYGAPQGGGYGAPQGGRGGGYGQGNTGYGAPQGGRNDDPWASQGGSSAYSDDAPF
ncbi:single-stranded DNA-binding protein [Buchananella felis]|uniref:single-stranded DNA-binding protein n=1 Tax=Buchananella felis TaxID=3231492 RepID=UPI003527D747